jgi:NADH-quinone oxidoreductase subunit A
MIASSPYAPILILLLLVIALVLAIMVLSHSVGTKRHGPRKDAPYEAGMPVLVDARQRFRARFYVIALLFLLFDVEVVLLWPWAVVFHRAATSGELVVGIGTAVGSGFLLVSMLIFLVLLVVGLVYERGRGALRLG